MGGQRDRARWLSAGTEKQLPLFAGTATDESRIAIPPPSAFEDTRADYASTGLTPGAHPLALVRRQLRALRYHPARDLAYFGTGRPARYSRLVILPQRPPTARGPTH